MYDRIPSCKAGTEGNTDGKLGCVDIAVVVGVTSTKVPSLADVSGPHLGIEFKAYQMIVFHHEYRTQ